ncbi:MAG: cupin domain-containing protein [Planctomycetota bacterium]
MTNKFALEDVEQKEIVAGFRGRMIHTDSMTLAYWSIAKDASLPAHHHVHEQVVNMLEGEFELVVDGTPHHLKPGDIVVIPSNVPHGGRAITDCRILDVFQPARDDYR